jgi:hypothetical protein
MFVAEKPLSEGTFIDRASATQDRLATDQQRSAGG